MDNCLSNPRLAALAAIASLMPWMTSPGAASELVDVQPLTERIVMLHFNDGHVQHHQRGEPRGAEKVFADPAQRRRLEAILHPLIGDEVVRQAARAQGLYVVFVVPLLVESGRWLDRIDRLCVVDCDEATQIARVGRRSGIPPDTVRRILAAQATRAERLALADDVIVNDVTTSVEDLERQVLVLHKAWCNLAGSVPKPSAVHPFGIGQQ